MCLFSPSGLARDSNESTCMCEHSERNFEVTNIELSVVEILA